MYDDKQILALIPARGGSKGIKNKNIIELLGKPLIAYSIEVAKRSKYIDDIIVSTDSEEIASISEKFGAEIPFLRPKQFATDEAKTIEAVIHAIQELRKQNREYDCLVLLQPTQPLRTFEDIDLAVEEYYKNGQNDLVSVSPVDDNPILIRTVSKKGILKPLLDVSSTCRRQDMPEFFKVNGCIYINNISRINRETSLNDNKLPFIMSSEHAIDIDELKDLEVAKYFLNLRES